ncbi:hypothetical protein Kfla_0717 [Kribbella flavida DSM 17836]|uniref:Mycothiol-dependent maleylpyruvate isomerase metal-binding domain-containing protein n=1 Tax=Kribbella flavida (strain DSM 17836 / JCM 10339 / NBRC 14399) TaxID=479435 RepID=D2PYJ1_KRIFD|nr:TIGR03086 family metal-binding protein [Kribbella flavida]ADB29837.1 hypothetical protein Kfla_0717 [Kribbella flavida DSM 17836]
MEQIAERYRRRAGEFERRVAAVAVGDWARPSPCERWTARDVVAHVVDMHRVMLGPVNRDFERGADLLATFRAARSAVEAVLDDPEVAAQQVETPAGSLTVAEHVDQVVSDDLVLHGWDLARATGQDETMDPDDVQRLWRSTTSVPADVMAKYHTPGAFGPGIEVFGPEVAVPADAPLQDRLLGLIGRDPSVRR